MHYLFNRTPNKGGSARYLLAPRKVTTPADKHASRSSTSALPKTLTGRRQRFQEVSFSFTDTSHFPLQVCSWFPSFLGLPAGALRPAEVHRACAPSLSEQELPNLLLSTRDVARATEK